MSAPTQVLPGFLIFVFGMCPDKVVLPVLNLQGFEFVLLPWRVLWLVGGMRVRVRVRKGASQASVAFRWYAFVQG